MDSPDSPARKISIPCRFLDRRLGRAKAPRGPDRHLRTRLFREILPSKMRFLTAIFLAILLHLGVFTQKVRASDDGGEHTTESCCVPDKGHDVSSGGPARGCPEDDACPVEGDHCHHHGMCLSHGLTLIFGNEAVVDLLSPEARDLRFDIADFWAEDGPVMKLDKPPLI